MHVICLQAKADYTFCNATQPIGEIKMIEVLTGLPDGTVGFRATGKVTGDDYDQVLTKSIDSALQEHNSIQLLAVIGPNFDGYTLQAAWDDTKLGMRHWSGFDRIALVTDTDWVENAMKAMSFMLPCPVKLFDLDEQDDARRWLSESLGTVHISNDQGITIAQLIGNLETSAYDDIDVKIDNAFSQSAAPSLLLDLREFDGWSGISALGKHLSMVRKHHRQPHRIAIVGDETWQKMAEKVLSLFVNAKTRFFDEDDYDDARVWIAKT